MSREHTNDIPSIVDEYIHRHGFKQTEHDFQTALTHVRKRKAQYKQGKADAETDLLDGIEGEGVDV